MKPPGSDRDRRRERRVPCELVCSIRRLAEPGGLASAVDLSASGMRFQFVGSAISPSEKVLVQFTISSSTYSFCGRPVRVTTPAPFTQEVSVLFQSVDDRTRSLLGEAIARNLDTARQRGRCGGDRLATLASSMGNRPTAAKGRPVTSPCSHDR